MTKFNAKNIPEEDLTYGDVLGPAMEITRKDDAAQYLKEYVAFIQKDLDEKGLKDDATAIAKSNLGYYAGYYSNAVRERVEELFECNHPVFGSIKENGAPSAAEAFQMGVESSSKK